MDKNALFDDPIILPPGTKLPKSVLDGLSEEERFAALEIILEGILSHPEDDLPE